MKKIVCLLLMALMGILSCSSAKLKIEKDMVDKVTKDRIIETCWYSFPSSKNKTIPDINIRFVYKHGEEYMEIRYVVNNDVTVNQHSSLIIKTEQNQTFYGEAIEKSYSKTGDGAVGYAGSHALGLAVNYNSDFIWMHDYLIQSLILETTSKRIEIKVEKKYAKDLKKLYQKLFEKIEKHYKK